MSYLRCFSLFLLLILSFFPPAFSSDALVIQSRENAIFSQMLKGIEKNWQGSIERKFLPEDSKQEQEFFKELSLWEGKIIFVLGDEALWKINSLKINAPVVFGGIINPWRSTLNDNVCGFSFEYPPSEILGTIKDVFPTIARIGTICNPKVSNKTIEAIEKLGRSLNLEIIKYPAESESEMLVHCEINYG